MSVAQANRDMLHFAGCMKAHGVEGLPSPVADPGGFKRSLTATTPNFTAAMTACGHLLPGQQNGDEGRTHTHRQIEGALAFARCMRAHGFSRFPDPTSSGALTHEMLAQAGISLQQPATARSADACVGVTHGVITRTMVARFIAGR